MKDQEDNASYSSEHLIDEMPFIVPNNYPRSCVDPGPQVLANSASRSPEIHS